MRHECPHIELQLAGFAAGELAGDEAAHVAAHLAACADCRRELERELLLRRTLADLPVQSMPTPVTPPARRRRLVTRQAWLPLTGGLAAAALALTLLIPHGPQNDGPLPPMPTVYTAADLASARQDARSSLALAARILARSERLAVADVFGRRLPRAVEGSLSDSADQPEGGQG